MITGWSLSAVGGIAIAFAPSMVLRVIVGGVWGFAISYYCYTAGYP